MSPPLKDQETLEILLIQPPFISKNTKAKKA